jgi:hypothetical protein
VIPQGRIIDAIGSATIRLSDALMVDLSYLLDRLRDERSGELVYANTITRLRVGEQFTRAAALRAIVQYSQLTVNALQTTLQPDRNINYDVLFTFLTMPGTAVYVGANYNLANIDPLLVPTATGLLRSSTLNNTGWQVFTKMSYLFRR